VPIFAIAKEVSTSKSVQQYEVSSKLSWKQCHRVWFKGSAQTITDNKFLE